MNVPEATPVCKADAVARRPVMNGNMTNRGAPPASILRQKAPRNGAPVLVRGGVSLLACQVDHDMDYYRQIAISCQAFS